MIVVDDEIVRIGSANLANRSMGLDTECDLTIEALGRDDVRDAIRDLRARLLGEHLGCEPARVRETIERTGSMRAAIDELAVQRAHSQAARGSAAGFPDHAERGERRRSGEARGLSDLANLLSSDDETEADGPRSPAWGKIAMFALVCVALTALWKYTPLATFLDGNHITGWARRAGDEWWVPILTVLRVHAGRVHAVSATAAHAVRGHRVRSDHGVRLRDARHRAVRMGELRARQEDGSQHRAPHRRHEAQRHPAGVASARTGRDDGVAAGADRAVPRRRRRRGRGARASSRTS